MRSLGQVDQARLWAMQQSTNNGRRRIARASQLPHLREDQAFAAPAAEPVLPAPPHLGHRVARHRELVRRELAEQPADRLKGGGRGALECKRLIEADETSWQLSTDDQDQANKVPGLAFGSACKTLASY